MGKSTTEEILEGLQEFPLPTYIGKGKIHPEGITSRNLEDLVEFEDLTDLLRIYFLVSGQDTDSKPSVTEFVEDLRRHLRRIETTTSREPTLLRGKVRGEIDWQQTYKTRANRGGAASQIYACLPPEIEYDTEENLVLKLLLNHLRETVELFEDLAIDEAPDPQKYEWFSAWLDKTSAPRENLDYALDQNVYLTRRISDVSEDDVTGRMIENARQSRKKIYRDAAELLGRYRRLLSLQGIDDRLAEDLLFSFCVHPDDTPTLFELYWVFETVQAFSKADASEGVTLNTITKQGNQLHKDHVATWQSSDSGDEFVLYHDYNTYAGGSKANADLLWGVDLAEFRENESSDSDYVEFKRYLRAFQKTLQASDTEGLSIDWEASGDSDKVKELLNELQNEEVWGFIQTEDYIERGLEVTGQSRDIEATLRSNSNEGSTDRTGGLDTVWKGRPDLVIKRTSSDGNIKQVLIGEVKHTRTAQTVKNGITELLEYIKYVKETDSGNYVLDSETNHSEEQEIDIRGVLYIDKLPAEYSYDPTNEELSTKAGECSIDIVEFEQRRTANDEFPRELAWMVT